MHPAYSVILFTTAAGAGYGLLGWLAAGVLVGAVAPTGAFAATALVLALALITAGLLSSTLHLGRPERAWRAMSQWSTSWLSREGVLAVATYVPTGLWLLAAALAPGLWWIVTAALALASLVGAIATVWATGMIYQSLPTIRAWSEPLVAPVYLVLSAATGGTLLVLLQGLSGGSTATAGLLAAVALAAGGVLKWLYWQRIDTAPRTWTAEAATGLGSIGRVRPVDPPHTQANFVMREMGYRVARRHAKKLRLIALLVGFLGPAALLLLALSLPQSAAVVAIALAVVGAGIGVMVERWLFFAEAEHVVTLYYGAERV
jgi:DMSO reductase anchor subunit